MQDELTDDILDSSESSKKIMEDEKMMSYFQRKWRENFFVPEQEEKEYEAVENPLPKSDDSQEMEETLTQQPQNTTDDTTVTTENTDNYKPLFGNKYFNEEPAADNETLQAENDTNKTGENQNIIPTATPKENIIDSTVHDNHSQDENEDYRKLIFQPAESLLKRFELWQRGKGETVGRRVVRTTMREEKDEKTGFWEKIKRMFSSNYTEKE